MITFQKLSPRKERTHSMIDSTESQCKKPPFVKAREFSPDNFALKSCWCPMDSKSNSNIDKAFFSFECGNYVEAINCFTIVINQKNSPNKHLSYLYETILICQKILLILVATELFVIYLCFCTEKLLLIATKP